MQRGLQQTAKYYPNVASEFDAKLVCKGQDLTRNTTPRRLYKKWDPRNVHVVKYQKIYVKMSTTFKVVVEINAG